MHGWSDVAFILGSAVDTELHSDPDRKILKSSGESLVKVGYEILISINPNAK